MSAIIPESLCHGASSIHFPTRLSARNISFLLLSISLWNKNIWFYLQFCYS